jgi:hypothetical protein
MHAIRRTSRRGAPRVYWTCNNWRVNGACTNGLSLHLLALDTAILSTLKTDVLTEEIIEAVVTRTIELARLEPDEHTARRQSLLAERQRLEGGIRNLTEAVASGAGALPSLVAALKDRERLRADVLARLEHMDGLSRAPEWGDGIRAKLRARITEWHGFLGRQPEIARQICASCLSADLCSRPTRRLECTGSKGARRMAVCWKACSM